MNIIKNDISDEEEESVDEREIKCENNEVEKQFLGTSKDVHYIMIRKEKRGNVSNNDGSESTLSQRIEKLDKERKRQEIEEKQRKDNLQQKYNSACKFRSSSSSSSFQSSSVFS
jgi:16S rRNA U1498 N3-methylase RsmE